MTKAIFQFVNMVIPFHNVRDKQQLRRHRLVCSVYITTIFELFSQTKNNPVHYAEAQGTGPLKGDTTASISDTTLLLFIRQEELFFKLSKATV